MIKMIPEILFNAALKKEDYFSTHRAYTQIYNLTDKAAWEKLEDDLSFHGLPNRYTSDRCFYSARHTLVRANIKSTTDV